MAVFGHTDHLLFIRFALFSIHFTNGFFVSRCAFSSFSACRNSQTAPNRSLELNGLDALNIHKQRAQKFDMGAKQAVSEKLLDGTGTGEPMTPSTGSGGTKSSGKSTPAGSTDQPPPSFGTTKAPGQKDAFAMAPLNRVLVAQIALVLVIDVILIWIKCKKNN